MTTPITWTLVCTLKSGHRIFSASPDGALAIADKSGTTPDKTDDGILWLCPSWRAHVGDTWVSLPVIVDRRKEIEDCGSRVGVELADIPQLYKLGYKHFELTDAAQKLANTWRTLLAIIDVAAMA
jgi:hypothetical protein